MRCAVLFMGDYYRYFAARFKRACLAALSALLAINQRCY